MEYVNEGVCDEYIFGSIYEVYSKSFYWVVCVEYNSIEYM